MHKGETMTFDFIAWDEPGDRPNDVEHIAEHGVTPDEVEDVLSEARDRDVFPSESSGRPSVIGETRSGRTLFVTFDRDDQGGFIIIYPVTAYDVEP
jgi:uncharacterized DUF497 family protein